MTDRRHTSLVAAHVPLNAITQGGEFVLRPQLALYLEHGMKPRRIDPVRRISLAILSRFFNCGSVRSKSVLGGLHHEHSLCPA